MALEIGKYINTDLTFYIDQWVNTSDIKQLSNENNASSELGRKLARGERKITENNLPLIRAIIAKAVENREKRLSEDKRAHKKAIALI